MAVVTGYQRGQIPSFAFNETNYGASRRDLFTNTGTTPMRVIINGVSAVSDPGANTSRMIVMLGIRQNGSTASNGAMLAAWKLQSDLSNGLSSVSMYPNYQGPQSTSGNPGTSLSNQSWVSTTIDISTATSNTTPFSHTGTILIGGNGAGGTNFSNLSQTDVVQQVPPYFWLMPGDVLSARVFTDSAITGVLNYSFTTVTDSGG